MREYLSKEIGFLNMIAAASGLNLIYIRDYRMAVSLKHYIEFKLNRELTKLGIQCQ